MSVVSTRSTTGCYACKVKYEDFNSFWDSYRLKINRRKKCDETKPSCLRCQKSNTACPGYIYIELPNKPTRKLRTLLAPRTLVGRSRALQGTNLVNPEDIGLQAQGQSSMDFAQDLNIPDQASETPLVDNAKTLAEDIDISNPWVFLSSFSGSLQHPSIDLGASLGLTLDTTIPGSLVGPHSSSFASMTPGQTSILKALFSLSQLPEEHPLTGGSPKQTVLPVSGIELQEDSGTPEDEDPEGIVAIVCWTPALDKATEGNALPFVLHSYATWIRRMAFEPLRMTCIARDFVFSHFSGGEESRWILTLLANIGSKIGSPEAAEGKHDNTLSTLQNAVRRRLAIVNSRPESSRPELVKALDSALETIIINFFISPISNAITLRQEAAPIFQRLCPEPPGVPINLRSLLFDPSICLRHYAHIDILFSVVMDVSTLFRYDTTRNGSRHPNCHGPTLNNQNNSGIQWLHGIPDTLLLLFARMKSMRETKSTPNSELVASFESEICELQPFSSPSSESFMVIMRFTVQECWRQVAYVYLYMALCGDLSNTLRVKEAFKRFMKLLCGISPGRLPDEFLIMNLILMAPAAQQKRDREVIRQRILGVCTHSRTYRANYDTICIIDDYWARADAEGRPVEWSDVAASRMRVLGA